MKPPLTLSILLLALLLLFFGCAQPDSPGLPAKNIGAAREAPAPPSPASPSPPSAPSASPIQSASPIPPGSPAFPSPPSAPISPPPNSSAPSVSPPASNSSSSLSSLNFLAIPGTGRYRPDFSIPGRTMSDAFYYYSPLLATLLSSEEWEGRSIIETSGRYDSRENICEMWYRAGPAGREAIGYARSDDSNCRRWQKLSRPVLTDPQGVLMPYVFEKDGLYWMLAKRNMDRGFWLYRSSNKFDWTLAQTEPILLPSSDPAAWDYEIHNPAILFQGETGYLFYEGANGTHWAFQVGAIPVRWTRADGKPGTAGPVSGGPHPSANASAVLVLDGPRPAKPILPANEAFWRAGAVGNPEIIPIPERHAVMLIAGGFPPYAGGNTSLWAIGCASANESGNLSDPSAWSDCPRFLLVATQFHVADPSLIVTRFNKTDNLVLLYSLNQQFIHQTHSNLSLGEFYDQMMAPVPGGGAAARSKRT